MSKGLFISFEGGEGSGKTTQIKRLEGFLKAQNHDVFLTREPGGTPEGERIRTLFVQSDGGHWNAMSEVLLMFAARAMHVENVIKPAVAKGQIVMCDRFTDSTLAYQGYGRGLDLDKIRHIAQISIDNFAPDLTFILDIDAKIGLKRSLSRLSEEHSAEDRFERMDIAFHEKLRAGFLEIAKRDKKRCVVIDAQRSVDEIFLDIKSIMLERLGI